MSTHSLLNSHGDRRKCTRAPAKAAQEKPRSLGGPTSPLVTQSPGAWCRCGWGSSKSHRFPLAQYDSNGSTLLNKAQNTRKGEDDRIEATTGQASNQRALAPPPNALSRTGTPRKPLFIEGEPSAMGWHSEMALGITDHAPAPGFPFTSLNPRATQPAWPSVLLSCPLSFLHFVHSRELHGWHPKPAPTIPNSS